MVVPDHDTNGDAIDFSREAEHPWVHEPPYVNAQRQTGGIAVILRIEANVDQANPRLVEELLG
jgi:hypothetical protein